MLMHNRIPNLMPRWMCACSNARWKQVTVAAVCDRRPLCNANLLLYVGNNLFRFQIAPMNHQPARTLRNPAAKENHNQTQRRTDSKSESPPKPDWNPVRIEQHKCSGCTQGGADPVYPIDDQINTAGPTRRDEVLNRGGA